MVFGLGKKVAPKASSQSERSTLDRLLEPNCPQEAFVLLYCKLIEERFPDNQLTLEEPTIIFLKSSTGVEHRIFLDNLWIQLKETEDGRRELVERYLAMIVSPQQSQSAIQPSQIIPIIKDSIYLEMLKDQAVADHFAADVWVVYAVDLEDRTQSLSSDTMKELGLERTNLRDLAIANLRRVLPEIEYHGTGPWFLITAGGDYVASILLLDNVWEELAGQVEGDIVAAVPTRDVLLFTGAKSKEGLAAIREKATGLVNGGDHVISNTLLRRQNERWIVFD